MPTVRTELRNVAGTEAALGWAGAQTMVVDRPDGVAGGLGLGFNGGQLLALSIGGCFCNDLRFAAHQLGVGLGEIRVSVELDLSGEPLVADGARMVVHCTTADGTNPGDVISRAEKICTVKNSVERGFPVVVTRAGVE